MAWILTALIMVGAAALRLPLLDVPLDRDEGEYAYVARLLLDGIPPFADAHNMKMPGIYAVYSVLLTVFGSTHTAIHLGLLFANALSIALVFLLGRRLMDATAGVAAAATYALLTLSETVLGSAANAEHFVVPLALSALVLLDSARERSHLTRLLLAGLLLGLAVLVKQHGVFFLAFALLVLALARQWRRAVVLLAAAMMPAAALVAVMAALGLHRTFWFWTVQYAFAYASALPLSAGVLVLMSRLEELLAPTWPLWVLAAAGGVALFVDERARRWRGFLLPFALTSALATAVGFYFRPPYFVLVAPAIAITLAAAPARSAIAGAAASVIAARAATIASPMAARAATAAIIALAGISTLWAERTYLFELTPTMVARRLYGGNPFPEALEVARYIRERSAPADRIAVLGSEPEIYFYSGRRAATGYLHTYPLMEAQPYAARMQREMVGQIERARPAFLVYVNVPASWLIKENSDPFVLTWFEAYQRRYYERVGVVDILSPGFTLYLWDAAAAGYTPRSNVWLAVFKLRDASALHQ